MKHSKLAILIAAIIVGLGIFLFQQRGGFAPSTATTPTLTIAEQPGQKQVRQIEGYAQDGCIITGCNREICINDDRGEGDMLGREEASICISNPVFDCYKTHGVCRRLYGDSCGWDPTSQLTACIAEKMAQQPKDTTPLEQLQLPGGGSVQGTVPPGTTTDPKE